MRDDSAHEALGHLGAFYWALDGGNTVLAAGHLARAHALIHTLPPLVRALVHLDTAFYNAPHQRIEMHLVSRAAQTVNLLGESLHFAEAETIHTENSHKFTVEGLRTLAARAGFGIGPVWTDPERLFSVHWLPAAQ